MVAIREGRRATPAPAVADGLAGGTSRRAITAALKLHGRAQIVLRRAASAEGAAAVEHVARVAPSRRWRFRHAQDRRGVGAVERGCERPCGCRREAAPAVPARCSPRAGRRWRSECSSTMGSRPTGRPQPARGFRDRLRREAEAVHARIDLEPAGDVPAAPARLQPVDLLRRLTHTVSPCCAASGHSSASSTPSSNSTGSVMPALAQRQRFLQAGDGEAVDSEPEGRRPPASGRGRSRRP
jgi:hypothetical protein